MKKTIGFYLTAIACVLGIVGMMLYSRVHLTEMLVYVMLVCSAVVGVLAMALQVKIGHSLANSLVAVSTVLVAVGLGLSIRPVVLDFSNAISGLDIWDILNEYFAFLGFTAASWVVFLVCAFTGVGKEE